MNTYAIKLFKELGVEYSRVLMENNFLRNCIYTACNNINSDFREVYNINKDNVLLISLNGSTILGNIIENAIFAEICKNKNFTFTHYNADAQHKDITCECINCISNSLKEKLKEAKQYYGNHSSFDTPNIFGLEIKTSKKFTEITANKTASTNVNVQKDPFSFYLMINYELNYYDGLPQIENIQARLCWIDNTADIWGKTYETSDNISIKYSTAPDIFVGIIDDRKYTKSTKIRLGVHPDFK